MKFNRFCFTLLFTLSLSVFTTGCGEAEVPADPNAPAPDVVPEADFEGEAAQPVSPESDD